MIKNCRHYLKLDMFIVQIIYSNTNWNKGIWASVDEVIREDKVVNATRDTVIKNYMMYIITCLCISESTKYNGQRFCRFDDVSAPLKGSSPHV